MNTRLFLVCLLSAIGCNRESLSESSSDLSGFLDGNTPAAADAALPGCGPSCDMSAPCLDGSCVRVVFVTSDTFGGNLGGLDGADAKCQSAADARSLPGTYKAWLSTSTVAARDRLTHFTGPYVLVNHAIVAAEWGQLALSTHPIPWNLTEQGYPLGRDGVWTATEPNGTWTQNQGDCDGWTSTSGGICAGDPSHADSFWTVVGCGFGCGNNTFHLYCIQQ